MRVACTLSGGQPLDLSHLPKTTRAALEGHGAAAPGLPPASEVSTLRDNGLGDTVTGAPTLDGQRRSERVPTADELRSLLAHHHGNIAAVGVTLGKHRMQVHRWLRRYNIDVNDYRER